MKTAEQQGAAQYLIVCMAYCMSWELAGSRAWDHWQEIHAFLSGENMLDTRQRWMVELYEEGAPTAQEERSVRSRIDGFLHKPRDVAYFGNGILNLLPAGLREAAAAHSFMNGLAMPPAGYGKLKSWVLSWQALRFKAPTVRVLPLAEREADFDRFMALPYSLEGFRKFWRVEPKMRSNRRTRVLVSLGAVFSQIIRVDESVDFDLWIERLAAACHFTLQTKTDLRVLMNEMAEVSYDMQELAYRLFVDAREVDQQNLMDFIECHRDELTDLAPELVRDMKPDVESV